MEGRGVCLLTCTLSIAVFSSETSEGVEFCLEGSVDFVSGTPVGDKSALEESGDGELEEERMRLLILVARAFHFIDQATFTYAPLPAGICFVDEMADYSEGQSSEPMV
jgi:hypothetical protein